MNNLELIKYESGLVKRVDSAINVTNKLLALQAPQLIPYRIGEKWGFCTVDKKIVIDCIFFNVEEFNTGIALVNSATGYYFLNIGGERINTITYRDARSFCEGLAVVFDPDFGYCYINKFGRISIMSPAYKSNTLIFFERIRDFENGFAKVRSNEKWGIINQLGEVVIPFLYTDEYDKKFILEPRFEKENNSYKILKKDSISQLKEKYGYENIGDFYEGLAQVTKDGYSGFINMNFEVVIPLLYCEVYDFKNEIAYVGIYNEEGDINYGYINKEGIQYWEE